MPNVIKGRDLNIYVMVNGVMQPVCYAKSCSLDITYDAVEKTGRRGNAAKDYVYGRYGYTLSIDGNMNMVPGNGKYFIDAILNRKYFPFRFSDGANMEFSGTVMVNSASIAGPMGDLASFSNAMQGKGELQYKELSTASITDESKQPVLIDTDLEPFFNTRIFTYNGSNNVQQLSFVARAVQGGATLNQTPIYPDKDYYFSGSNIVLIPDNLILNIEYKLFIPYYK